METIKTKAKRQNIINAVATKNFNRKVHKFNNFNEVDNKRNKAENKLYNLLDQEQKYKFNFICEVLNLDLRFFNECDEKGFKLCNNKEVKKYGLVKCFNIDSENFTTYKMSEIENLFKNDEDDEFKGCDLMEPPQKCENVFFKAIDENFNKLTTKEKINIVVNKILNEGAEIEGNKLIENYKLETIKDGTPQAPSQTPKKPTGKKIQLTGF